MAGTEHTADNLDTGTAAAAPAVAELAAAAAAAAGSALAMAPKIGNHPLLTLLMVQLSTLLHY